MQNLNLLILMLIGGRQGAFVESLLGVPDRSVDEGSDRHLWVRGFADWFALQLALLGLLQTILA